MPKTDRNQKIWSFRIDSDRELTDQKLIILHRNLDVNESQFQDKSKQIILHHRSLCKMIVIEINRSKLIILHRNLDVNESQGEFQENKSKQIILHHRSLCKIDGKFKTDHFASQITVQN